MGCGAGKKKYAPYRDNARELSSPDALLRGLIHAGLTGTFFVYLGVHGGFNLAIIKNVTLDILNSNDF